MKSVIICNAGENFINKFELENCIMHKISVLENRSILGLQKGLITEKEIFLCNSKHNAIFILDRNKLDIIREIPCYTTPNDIILIDETLYITMADSNSILVYDYSKDYITKSVKVGSYPSSLIQFKDDTLIVSNFLENNVLILDRNTLNIIEKVKTRENPGKMIYAPDEGLLFLCENNLNGDLYSYIKLIDHETLNTYKEIRLCNGIINICKDDSYLYAINLTNGFLSIINYKKGTVEKDINIGGMPSDIIKSGNSILITDMLNNKLLVIDIMNKSIKKIATGKEPIAMLSY